MPLEPFIKKLIKSFDFYNEKFKNCGLENYELVLKLLNQIREELIIFYFIIGIIKNISIIRQKIINYEKLFHKMNLGKYSKNKTIHGFKMKKVLVLVIYPDDEIQGRLS